MSDDELLAAIRQIIREELDRARAPTPPVAVTPGCMCPAGAEAVCRAPLCPRRGPPRWTGVA